MNNEKEIPFGASDSELMEATYFIPQGFHAVIDGNKVIIKKGENSVSNDLEEASYNFVMNNFGNPKEPLYKFDQRCFKAGAQWQKKQLIAKACEWLLKNDSYAKPTEVLVRDFKKAVEE